MKSIVDSIEPEQQVLSADVIETLCNHKPGYIQRFILEVTDHCNLRCRYCHQSRPSFTPTRHMHVSLLATLTAYASKNGIRLIDLTGAGDMMMHPEWETYCKDLLDGGVELMTTINLGNMLTKEQADILSRFKILSISLDSVNRQVLAEVRKRVDVRTIVYNIQQIKMSCLSAGRPEPEWIITAVYSAEIASEIDQVACYAVSISADVFQIQDLVEYDDLDDNVTNVFSLTGDEALECVNATLRAFDVIRNSGVSLNIQPGFEQRVKDFRQSLLEGQALQIRALARNDVATYVDKPKEGETRDCMDPWSFVQVLANGVVRVCCFGERANVGVIDANTNLDEVLNNQNVRDLRRELVTGDLNEYCQICTFKKSVSVERYRDNLERFIERGEKG